MKIGELASRASVGTKTIRYYEEIGLMPEPERAPNGYREFDEHAVGRLRFIRDAQATGLTLMEIASILDLRGHGEGTCFHVIDLLERHLEDLDQHIEKLHQTRDQLITLTQRAKGLDPEDCTDPNRCQTIAADVDSGALRGLRIDHLSAHPHHTHS